MVLRNESRESFFLGLAVSIFLSDRGVREKIEARLGPVASLCAFLSFHRFKSFPTPSYKMPLASGLSSLVTIPTPDYDVFRTFSPIASLETPRGHFNFYWWSEMRRVIVYGSVRSRWRMMPDCNIGETLERLLDIDVEELEVDDMLLYVGVQGPYNSEWSHGTAIDDERRGAFFDCDWSDYATDYLKVSGEIRRRLPPAEPLEAAQRPDWPWQHFPVRTRYT